MSSSFALLLLHQGRKLIVVIISDAQQSNEYADESLAIPSESLHWWKITVQSSLLELTVIGTYLTRSNTFSNIRAATIYSNL